MAKAEREPGPTHLGRVEASVEQFAQPHGHIHAWDLEQELDVAILHRHPDVLDVNLTGPKGPSVPKVDFHRLRIPEHPLHTSETEKKVGDDRIGQHEHGEEAEDRTHPASRGKSG